MTTTMPQQRKSPVQLDVVIVGAGLSGLATAIAAARSGHRVVVIESVKEIREVGAGLQVTPNATRILEAWGLMSRLEAEGAVAEPRSLLVHRYSGEVLAREDRFAECVRARYGQGAPFVDLHRCDLQSALYARAEELGVRFMLGQRVDQVDFESPPSVRCFSAAGADGGPEGEGTVVVRGDLVVAADGLWSRCRACLLGRDDPPLPTGDLAYRVVLDLAAIEDPELRAWVETPSVHFWIGPGAHAVGYSLRGGRMFNIVLLVPDDLPEGVRKRAGSIEEMRALFQGWDPVLNRFLGLVDEVDKWKLMHRDELDSWVNEQGTFAFVGDACHPMLPYLAQGANSSIEDGASLGLLLGHITSKDQLPQILKMYEGLRKTRGEAIVKETFKQRHDFHMPDGPEQEARDQIFLSQLGKELKGPFPSRWTCPEVQPWIYGYDVFREVEEAVAKSSLAAGAAGAASAEGSKQREGGGRDRHDILGLITSSGSYLRGIFPRIVKWLKAS